MSYFFATMFLLLGIQSMYQKFYSAKTAKEAIGAMNLLPAETVAELAKHTIEGLVETEQGLLDVIVKPPHQAPKVHAAPPAPKKAAKKRPAAKHKPVPVTA